jgi:N-acetylglucosamine-6-phosphate deacetylase
LGGKSRKRRAFLSWPGAIKLNQRKELRKMADFVIYNANIVHADGIMTGGTVAVEDGRIVSVSGDPARSPSDDGENIDAGGNFLSAGFIDLHTHGLLHYLTDNGPEALEGMCKVLPRLGVTSFLPTVCARPKGQEVHFLTSLARVRSRGAQILGFHLEGPFLALIGSMRPEVLCRADSERAAALIEAAQPYPAVFSISPELDGIEELIPLMAEGNRPVFITHSKATVKETQAAIEAGARHATHFYDVFPCPPETDTGVRPCGAVEAILADRRVSVDFILDGEHVDAAAVTMALLCKGPDKVCLITDSVIGAGLPPGKHTIREDEVEFTYMGGPARTTRNSEHPGVLGGSGLTLNLAVRNAVEMLDVDMAQAVRMASANPAQVLHLQKSKGRIAEGFDADLVLFDKDINVLKTWIAGRCVYDKDSDDSGGT